MRKSKKQMVMAAAACAMMGVILYNGKVVKVTPLEYDGIFKWFSNRQ